jgi:hypothetical protein
MKARETGIARGLQAAPRLANLGGLGVVALGIKKAARWRAEKSCAKEKAPLHGRA